MATLLTETSEREVLTVTDAEASQARDLTHELSTPGTTVGLQRDRGDVKPLPSELAKILDQVVHALAEGHTITISTMPEELSTTTAARLLGISRPTLMKKLKAGDLPSHKVGTHSRLKTSDVLAFKRAERQKQRDAFDALRDLEEELGD